MYACMRKKVNILTLVVMHSDFIFILILGYPLEQIEIGISTLVFHVLYLFMNIYMCLPYILHLYELKLIKQFKIWQRTRMEYAIILHKFQMSTVFLVQASTRN